MTFFKSLTEGVRRLVISPTRLVFFRLEIGCLRHFASLFFLILSNGLLTPFFALSFTSLGLDRFKMLMVRFLYTIA